MAFDVNGARAAGWTDPEILAFMRKPLRKPLALSTPGDYSIPGPEGRAPAPAAPFVGPRLPMNVPPPTTTYGETMETLNRDPYRSLGSLMGPPTTQYMGGPVIDPDEFVPTPTSTAIDIGTAAIPPGWRIVGKGVKALKSPGARTALREVSAIPKAAERWYHGSKALFDDLDPLFSHPGSEHGNVSYLTNLEREAAKYGQVRSVPFSGKVFPETSTLEETPGLMQQVIDQLIAHNPKIAPWISSAEAQARKLGVKSNDVYLQEIRRVLPGDFQKQQNIINQALKALGYAAREYTEESGAKTLAVFDKLAFKK